MPCGKYSQVGKGSQGSGGATHTPHLGLRLRLALLSLPETWPRQNQRGGLYPHHTSTPDAQGSCSSRSLAWDFPLVQHSADDPPGWA